MMSSAAKGGTRSPATKCPTACADRAVRPSDHQHPAEGLASRGGSIAASSPSPPEAWHPALPGRARDP
jgi:hypothetical protein